MSAPLLPSDVSEQAADPVICEQCQVNENRIEDLRECISTALEFLVQYETETRIKESGTQVDQIWREELMKSIAACKRLG